MHYVVAVPLDKDLADFIGKKGSVNGITFYNRKQDDNTIVALAPTSLEEKFYSVAEAMLIADQIVLSTANVDKSFGEMLIACSLLGKHTIITKDNDVNNLLANGTMRDYELVDRQGVVDRILAFKPQAEQKGTRVDVDKAFPVKGIGTVALGIVKSGRVRVHDKLKHTSGKDVEVRSMQSQDVDIGEAEYGTRVGIALKGIEHDEMDKGDLLASDKLGKAKVITAEITKSGFVNESVDQTKLYQLVLNFSYTNARLELDGKSARIHLEKPISLAVGDKFLLIRAAVPRIFASGIVTATESG